MKRTLIAFGLAGGAVVPCVFLLLGWAVRTAASGDVSALALLHSVQLPLWPMSKLFLDDASGGRHWLYLPLAAVLSNALIYCAIGLVAAWGRARHWLGMIVTASVALAVPTIAWLGFGTAGSGFLVAAALMLTGIVVHRRCASG